MNDLFCLQITFFKSIVTVQFLYSYNLLQLQISLFDPTDFPKDLSEAPA